MPFTRWLRNLQSVIGLSATSRKSRRAARRRPTKCSRPQLEALEDRLTPSFSPVVSYPIDTSPQAVVTGDFNNDGHLDLATHDPAAGAVSVLLGDGAGGFGNAIHSYSLGGNRVSLTVADFDNDGDDDLAAAVYASFGGGLSGDSVRVFLSNGDGTFASPTDLPITGDYSLAVAAGDFNNDGNSDLLMSGYDLDDVSYGWFLVLSGNGQGEFALVSTFHLADYPWTAKLAVGDLNGDGNLDAITVQGEYGFTGGIACLGDGTGRFFSRHDFGAGLYSEGVAIGDFTGDGIPDLLTTGLYGLRGRGDGTFDDPIAFNGDDYVTGVAMADVNGDGKLDAVTSGPDSVRELLNNGSGALTYAGAYAVGTWPSAIAVGDFNGDGRPDVATADADSNTVSVLLNDGFWTPPPPPPPILRIGDVTVTEGNTGAVAATFTVTLSAASSATITVAYATGDSTATAASDYQAAGGMLTFAPGETSKTITVLVNGDRLAEPNETFVVNLSSPSNATIAEGQGVGAIVDDEPRISISDVSKKEGKKSQATLFTFTVTLSAVYDQAVTMSFRTVNGAATTSDSDYIANSGTLTFAPGETTKTITIVVNGDNKKESDETFSLDLFGNSGNSLFTKNRGLGTILNDD